MSEQAEKMIPVTKVQLHSLGENGRTRAIGSVTLADAFVVHGVRVVEGDKGVFVAMPQRQEDERYRDVAHPITAEMRTLLSMSVLEEYERLQQWEGPERSRGR